MGRPLLPFGVAAVVALLAGLAVGVRRRDRPAVLLGRAVEAAILAPLGGFVARSFIGLLLATTNDSPSAALALGWGFFIWPGLIDTLRTLVGAAPLFTPTALRWTAFGVGAGTGLMDGVGRIHRWRGPGLLTFLLDVTWGLPGSTNGCLIHLVNLAGAVRQDAPRTSAHRYFNGFRARGGYAITLGAVMSNVPPHSGALLDHERVHVRQNRLCGPFYAFTYVAWMVVLFPLALAVGALRRAPWRTVEGWCYLNNPWEAWAFTRGGWRDPRRVWGRAAFTAAAVPFFTAAAAGCVVVAWRVWRP